MMRIVVEPTGTQEFFWIGRAAPDVLRWEADGIGDGNKLGRDRNILGRGRKEMGKGWKQCLGTEMEVVGFGY